MQGARTALRRSDVEYQAWSPKAVAELVSQGKPVLVDFTADWCAICQVNKRVAIENKSVTQKLRDLGVTVLMADWTDQNDEVAKGLEEFNRAAVPLYVLYSGNPRDPPVILPQALTPGIVIDALEKHIKKK